MYAKPILRFNIDCGEDDLSVERSGNRFLICDNIDFREFRIARNDIELTQGTLFLQCYQRPCRAHILKRPE